MFTSDHKIYVRLLKPVLDRKSDIAEHQVEVHPKLGYLE